MDPADAGSRILVVEDDRALAADVAEYLRASGVEVEVVHRGDEALVRIREAPPAMVLLDVMLPGMNGVELCRAARARYTGPILMVTALGDDVDEIVGLEVGADDYLVKPVRPRVLLARIRTRLRSGAAVDGDAAPRRALTVGALHIEPASRTVRREGQELPLTTFEFDLLEELARRAGTPVSREDLCRAVRGVEYDGLDRSIDLGISRLRSKLGDDAKRPSLIKSVRGVGYLLARSS